MYSSAISVELAPSPTACQRAMFSTERTVTGVASHSATVDVLCSRGDEGRVMSYSLEGSVGPLPAALAASAVGAGVRGTGCDGLLVPVKGV
jgi:hypothetical protein